MNRLSQPGPMGHQQMPEQPTTLDDDFIDLGRLLRAVLRYKWGILGLAFAITLATGLIVSSMEPVYRATATLTLETRKLNLVGVEDIVTAQASSNYYLVSTEFEILKSRNLAERAVRRLKLHEHPVFIPEESEEEAAGLSLTSLLPAREQEPPVQLTPEELEEKRIQAVTDAVWSGLSVSQVGQWALMAEISYESTDREIAALVPNTVAEEFINSNLENRLTGTLQATDWLNERMEVLKQSLRESEQALQDFRDQEGLVDIEGVTDLGGNELKALSFRLQEATKARIEAQNIKDDVQGMDSASMEQLMTVPAVLQHQGIRQIKLEQSKVERKVAELAKRYGPKHPKMIAARSELSVANQDLAKEVREVVSGISREYEVALRNEEQLRANWETRKSEIQDFNRVEFQLQELQRNVETNRQLYDIFFTRIKTVSETGGFEKPHARIVDRAMTPSWPVKPNKRLSITLAFILGIMLGCGVAILLDILDNTIKSPDDVQDKLRAPLLGAIPRQKADKNGDFEQFWQKPQSQYAEAIRTIRTGVVLSSLDDPARVILVTSTVPGEGKSTTALNLGAALAQMESTLVIGADLRRPSLARQCGLAPNHQGLSHFVSGVAKLEDCIEKAGDLGVYVMPAGIIPPNPLEMISSKRFRDALVLLQDRFDRIVIDSAPVQAVSDALILASYADSVIYVVKADTTSATQAQKGIANIVACNEPLTGVVLNMFDTKKARSYYGSKYYQYGEYYQSEETPT